LKFLKFSRKKKITLAAHKPNASVGERPSGVGETRNSRDTLLLSAPKRIAEELSGSDCAFEPASCRAAPELTLDNGPREPRANKLPREAGNSAPPREGWRMLGGSWGCQPATAKWGRTSPQPRSRFLLRSQATPRRMSVGDMSGPMCSMPEGTTSGAQFNSAATAGVRQNRHPFFVTGVTDTRSCLSWLHALSERALRPD